MSSKFITESELAEIKKNVKKNGKKYANVMILKKHLKKLMIIDHSTTD